MLLGSCGSDGSDKGPGILQVERGAAPAVWTVESEMPAQPEEAPAAVQDSLPAQPDEKEVEEIVEEKRQEIAPAAPNDSTRKK